MLSKLLFITLLFASAFSAGIKINGNEPLSVDFFACAHQTHPDFVMLVYKRNIKINWAQFRQSHQNALDAGYKNVHVATLSWKLLEKDSLPENFSGHIWRVPLIGDDLEESWNPRLPQVQKLLYSEDKKIRDIMDSSLAPSLLYSLGQGKRCFNVSRGAKTEQCGKSFYPLTLSAECINPLLKEAESA